MKSPPSQRCLRYSSGAVIILLGGVLASDMMSPEGTQFATDYHVPDSRENYETMRAILDGRFASWRKQRT